MSENRKKNYLPQKWYQFSVIIFIVFLSFNICNSTERNSDKPQEARYKYCESKVDKKVCAALNKSITLYYQIVNHEPPGSYERNNSIRILANSIRITRQSTEAKFGHLESLKLYDNLYFLV